jgi:hypothetical protein
MTTFALALAAAAGDGDADGDAAAAAGLGLGAAAGLGLGAATATVLTGAGAVVGALLVVVVVDGAQATISTSGITPTSTPQRDKPTTKFRPGVQEHWRIVFWQALQCKFVDFDQFVGPDFTIAYD